MKVSVLIATAMVCGLSSGYSIYSWSEDLDSALENINISTDAQNTVKKRSGKNSPPCVTATDVACANTYEDANANANQATVIQQAIVGNSIPRVTINGVSAGEVDNKGIGSIGGY